MADCCGTCNAWMREGANGNGFCRAVPPTPIMVGMGQPGSLVRQQNQVQPIVVSFFPQMQAHGWCREFRPKVSN